MIFTLTEVSSNGNKWHSNYTQFWKFHSLSQQNGNSDIIMQNIKTPSSCLTLSHFAGYICMLWMQSGTTAVKTNHRWRRIYSAIFIKQNGCMAFPFQCWSKDYTVLTKVWNSCNDWYNIYNLHKLVKDMRLLQIPRCTSTLLCGRKSLWKMYKVLHIEGERWGTNYVWLGNTKDFCSQFGKVNSK